MSALLTTSAIEVVKEAFTIMRVIDPETPLEDIDRETGFRRLNYMIKSWRSQGFHLWTETEAVLPLVKGKQQYKLGSGGDKAFNANEFYNTTLSSNAVQNELDLTDVFNISASPSIFGNFDPTSTPQDWAATNATLSGALTITNTASNGFAEYSIDTLVGSEYIAKVDAVLLSPQVDFSAQDIDGQIEVSSITSNGSIEIRFTARQKSTNLRVLIAGGIGDSAEITNLLVINTSSGSEIGVINDSGEMQLSFVNFVEGNTITTKDDIQESSSGATVYYSKSPIERPLSVNNARYKESIGATEIPTNQWSRSDYFEQPNKTSQGIVSQWYYSPQLDMGELYVWQVASRNSNVLNFSYIRPTNIIEGNEDDPDFPSEWFLTLAYNLASMLAVDYPVQTEKLMIIESKARELLERSLGFDNEQSYMQMEIRRR